MIIASCCRQAEEGYQAAVHTIAERVEALLQKPGTAPTLASILEEALGSCSEAAANSFVSVRGSSAGCEQEGACRQYGAEQQVPAFASLHTEKQIG